jgi:hypothetical protein
MSFKEVVRIGPLQYSGRPLALKLAKNIFMTHLQFDYLHARMFD